MDPYILTSVEGCGGDSYMAENYALQRATKFLVKTFIPQIELMKNRLKNHKRKIDDLTTHTQISDDTEKSH